MMGSNGWRRNSQTEDSMADYTNDKDNYIDDLLFEYVDLKAPKSFFLFAGAGSGKTRSLVTLLKKIKDTYGVYYATSKKRVAVITYTNAAADEIVRRLGDTSIFSISTIHSFIWGLIKHYQVDIKMCMVTNRQEKIDELSAKKSTVPNQEKISKYHKELELVKSVKRFTYNPNGDNLESNSLSHQDVIKIGAKFIRNKALFQDIIIQQYPIILIDESQDTNKRLIESMFELQNKHQDKFVLGLFGDVKQRIYFDGKSDLGSNLPENWAQPVKELNHRSAKRIIKLANKVAENAKAIHPQLSRIDAIEGFTRMFIVDTGNKANKEVVENSVLDKMAKITADNDWINSKCSDGQLAVKKLILEHHMAASRLGFLPLFEPLYSCDDTKDGVLKGSIPELKLFIDLIVPIYRSSKLPNGKFAIAALVRKKSPLLDKNVLSESENMSESLSKANQAVIDLCSLWQENSPSLYEVVKCINNHSLFKLPDTLKSLCNDSETSKESVWETVKNTRLDQIIAYVDYISDNSEFGTHQGVKGLEYDRVMVLIDDSDARGNWFSYDKLFGVAGKSENDIKNENEGKETVIDRTTRLFYVTCTRAKKSLAIVAYTDKPELLKRLVVANNWFSDGEIEIL